MVYHPISQGYKALNHNPPFMYRTFTVLFKRDKMRLAEILFACVIIQNLTPIKLTEGQLNSMEEFQMEIPYVKEKDSLSSTYTYDYNSSRSNKSN